MSLLSIEERALVEDGPRCVVCGGLDVAKGLARRALIAAAPTGVRTVDHLGASNFKTL